MKTKFNGFLTLLLALLVQITFAQEKTVTGKVSDVSGPLPGVTVVVKGTNIGTLTDFDGNYSISANVGDVLQYSFLGMLNVESTVGASNVINILMEESAEALEEVVVTALGISREKRALGYAVTTIDTEDIESKPDVDIAKILRGKAAGVRITGTGGVSGSGSNIIIRGLSSISGGNQPLFIVDGVPFDGSSGSANKSDASSGDFQSGNVSSRFADIDPNNIENVSILKGLAATSIYGGDGRNGVILITTKTGKGENNKKLEVHVNQSVFFNEIVLPEYQDTWGNGFQNVYGAFFSNWGSRFDSQETIPNAFRTMMLNNFGVEPSVLFPDRTDLDSPDLPYVPHDSQGEYFETGILYSTSVNASGAIGDKGFFNLAYSNVDDKSFIPNNTLRRNSFSLGGSYKMMNNLTFTAKLNLVRTNIKSPFTDASTGSDVTISTAGTGGIASVWNILYLPRSIDINQPYQHPVTGESLWYRGGNDRMNPNWVLDNTQDTDNTDRVYGNYGVSYEFNDWLNMTYRVGIDITNRTTSRSINKGANDGVHPNGYLQTTNERFTIWDHTAMANFDKEISEDFSINGSVGVNANSRIFDRNGSESRNQIVFGLQNHGNYINTSSLVEGTTPFSSNVAYQYYERVNNNAVFATATVDYKNFLYFNATARNEWASTLEEANRSQFSPGLSLSFIATEAIEGLKSGKGLSFLKLRTSYGTAPGFPGPYNTRGVLALSPNLFTTLGGAQIIGTSVSNVLANSDLKPELSSEYEIGVEARFLDSRVGIETTLYRRETTDQIFGRALPPETGYTFTTENVGNVINKGIEINFDLKPVVTENLNWTVTGNYTLNESLVEGIVGDQFLYGGIFSTPQNAAINGEPLGVIYGARILRNANGDPLIDENGGFIQDPENGIIGDPNPKWFATIGSGLKWKDLTFNMQWEYQQGGDIYSTTIATLIGRGLIEDVDFDRTQGMVLNGIRESTGLPNDIQITSTEAYFDELGLAGIEEVSMYDATHLRLREISLSYSLPQKTLDKTPFGNISITLSGQNLWVKAFNTPESASFDPELNSLGVGNSFGFDYLTSWNSKRYGMSVKLSF